jgi:hypothetical protein
MVRDNYRIYGNIALRRIVPRHLRQGYSVWVAVAEQLCRTADRINPAKCLDHLVVVGEAQQGRILRGYTRLLQQDQDAPAAGEGCLGSRLAHRH